MWASSILWTTAVSPFVSEILETQEISLLCRGIFSDQASNPLWYSRITRYTVIIHQVLLNDIINTVLSLHKRSTVFSIDLADSMADCIALICPRSIFGTLACMD